MFLSWWIWIEIILICYPLGGNTIHYGENADFDRFEYMVCLTAYSGYDYTLCGGVIIDEFHILTAAHCVSDLQPENIIITAGRPEMNHPLGRSWAVEKIHSHPSFKENHNTPRIIYPIRKFLSCIIKNPDTCLVPKHDIAVLKLIRALPLGERIARVELPNSDSLPYCQTLEYAGWGYTEDTALPEYLQSTKMIILDPEECVKHYLPHRKSQFGAITVDHTALIGIGDSGSPLVDMNIVYGITSFMLGDSASTFVGFTKVFNYIHFINNITTSRNSTSDENEI